MPATLPAPSLLWDPSICLPHCQHDEIVLDETTLEEFLEASSHSPYGYGHPTSFPLHNNLIVLI